MYFTSPSILSARAMVVPGFENAVVAGVQFSNSDVFAMYQNLVEGRDSSVGTYLVKGHARGSSRR